MLHFVDKRLLVVGDVMLDEYIMTSVGRISPEAPVPVAQVREERHVPGGAANVACNLASLGCSVCLAGVCGTDGAGDVLADVLKAAGMATCLHRTDDRPTTQKSRVVSQGQQLLRLDREKTTLFPPAIVDALWQDVLDQLPHVAVVILSDYDKGLLRSGGGDVLAARVMHACAVRGIPVLVDPKGTDWSCYAGAACITPNVKELVCAAGLEDAQETTLVDGAHALMRRFHLPRLLLTRSEKGVALFERDAAPVDIPARVREVADVSGAGDTVIAVLAACVASGMEWLDAARVANMAAGLVVAKSGTSAVTRQELQDAVTQAERHEGLVDLDSRICSLAQLQRRVAVWKHAGQRIVFTNGCFDLLHIGHVRLLREAAAQGDKLIVAINADASVRRLKGKERPIQKAAARAAVMAALDGVDAVIVFEEDTPLRLIEALTPHVLVKGGDYMEATVVGAAHVLAHGGRVHIVPTVDGYSTTSLVAAMRN